jgi:hypothetical protein
MDGARTLAPDDACCCHGWERTAARSRAAALRRGRLGDFRTCLLPEGAACVAGGGESAAPATVLRREGGADRGADHARPAALRRGREHLPVRALIRGTRHVSQRMQDVIVSSCPSRLAGMVTVKVAAAPQFRQLSWPRLFTTGPWGSAGAARRRWRPGRRRGGWRRDGVPGRRGRCSRAARRGALLPGRSCRRY